MKSFWTIVLTLFLFISSPAFASSVSAKSDFEKAAQAYFTKDYKTAIDLFESLTKEEPLNGYLYYNLGNSYFKSGQLGEAILNYEKAKRIIPRNADLKVNLNLAYEKRADEVTMNLTDYLVNTFYFWSRYVGINELQAFVSIVSFLFWLIVFISVLRRRFRLSTRFILLCLVYLYVSGSYFLVAPKMAWDHFAIVLKPEVGVKAIYMDKDKPLFFLHEGTQVEIIDRQVFDAEKSWIRIRLPEGQKGWVEAQNLGVI